MELNKQHFALTEKQARELWIKVSELYHQKLKKKMPHVKSYEVYNEAVSDIWKENQPYFTQVFTIYEKYLKFLGMVKKWFYESQTKVEVKKTETKNLNTPAKPIVKQLNLFSLN
jgi:hypothetical protein